MQVVATGRDGGSMSLLTTAARKRRQRRQQILIGLLKVAAAMGLLGFTAYSSFEVGTAKTRTQKERLETELAVFRQRELERVRQDATAEDEVNRLSDALARVEADYNANVPTGDLKMLVDIVRGRLDEGVSVDRLAFVIREAAIERRCDREIESKRLQVRTPIVSNASNSIGFADNLVTVSGEGPSNRDDNGRPEAWFDPGQPVRLQFLTIGGKSEVIDAVLPITYSVVVGGNEYRFQATTSVRRGYVDVSAQVCDFP